MIRLSQECEGSYLQSLAMVPNFDGALGSNRQRPQSQLWLHPRSCLSTPLSACSPYRHARLRKGALCLSETLNL
ncbi:hypothetical protein Bpfe_030816 [Biomphalaria pfeifferi]|uniref:Uncharacterized protein n=1 Tax=Biomphalaria pfeifferi TaxID=112525 RepID=A0AAD8AP23_BIOPF|nr:hypothetical protein Bpfe_030816 [Biomphalaria pfeifferi]